MGQDMKEKYVYGSESALWMAFKNGDEQAYEFMFKHYYELLLNYGLKLNRDTEEIKDCIQQLFAGLWESRHRLGSNSCIKGYLLASLRRMILRRLNAKIKYVNLDDMDPAFHIETSVEFKYIKNQKEIERVKVLSNLIKKLPDRQKEALYLKFYGDHSFSEIAGIMGITTRGVYKLIYKALDHLTSEISERKSKFSYLLSIVFF